MEGIEYLTNRIHQHPIFQSPHMWLAVLKEQLRDPSTFIANHDKGSPQPGGGKSIPIGSTGNVHTYATNATSVNASGNASCSARRVDDAMKAAKRLIYMMYVSTTNLNSYPTPTLPSSYPYLSLTTTPYPHPHLTLPSPSPITGVIWV